MRNPVELLASALDAALPQTQCTRCGYPDCKAYALAMAEGAAGINQCPPGGQEGVSRLARLTGQTALPLNPEHGREAARQLAVIDEAWCIGCTLCLKACPVDCIVGGPKLMHTVIESQCTGCELCIPACPVDCISLRPATGARTGWDAWSAAQALEARQRYAFHRVRLERDDAQLRDRLAAPDPGAPGAPPAGVNDAAQVHAEALCARPADSGPRKAVIDAALARARAARSA